MRHVILAALALTIALPAQAQRNETTDRAAIHKLLTDYGTTLDARDWLEIAGGWPHLEPALVSRLGRALAAEPITPTVVTASAAAAAAVVNSAGSR